MNNQSIKPSRGWYILPAVIFLVGMGLFVGYLYLTICGMTSGLTRMVVPGEKVLTFSLPGRYTIYYEYQSVIGNKFYSTKRNISGMECTVTSESTGTEIPVSSTRISETYDFPDHSGYAVFDFQITTPGSYKISAQYSNNQSGPEIVLAVGRAQILKMVLMVFGGIGFFFLILILTIVSFLVIFVKRQSAKKKLLSRDATQCS